jgi:hypothetical protein
MTSASISNATRQCLGRASSEELRAIVKHTVSEPLTETEKQFRDLAVDILLSRRNTRAFKGD